MPMTLNAAGKHYGISWTWYGRDDQSLPYVHYSFALSLPSPGGCDEIGVRLCV